MSHQYLQFGIFLQIEITSHICSLSALIVVGTSSLGTPYFYLVYPVLRYGPILNITRSPGTGIIEIPGAGSRSLINVVLDCFIQIDLGLCALQVSSIR
jgi:hypothetical protein